MILLSAAKQLLRTKNLENRGDFNICIEYYLFVFMSYSKEERAIPQFHHTELLKDYKVDGIRLVSVPHMSGRSEVDENDLVNVRTNVGVAGEL